MAKKAPAVDDQQTNLAISDFENLLEEVETRLGALESGELSLEKALEAYEQGVKALRSCYRILKLADGKVQVLAGNGPDMQPVDYDVESGQPAKPAKASRAKSAPADDNDAEAKGSALF